MPARLTNVVKTEPFSIQDAATAVRFDYFTLKEFLYPIILFDHVHMHAAGFPPHPHAGLCVFSYLFEDSPGALRDRDSINREVLVEPGDLLWFQMASGLIHEENPAVDGVDINHLQVWVNLSRDKHDLPPATFLVKAADVPVAEPDGNRIRVVLGEYGDVASPPCSHRAIYPARHCAIVRDCGGSAAGMERNRLPPLRRSGDYSRR